MIFLDYLLILPWILMLGWVLYLFYKKKRRSSASRRAEELLNEVLSPPEYENLISHGYLELPSKKFTERVYRIHLHGDFVKVREKNREIMRLCLEPVDPLPRADVIVIHKLMIEADEERYLQTANQLGAWFLSPV